MTLDETLVIIIDTKSTGVLLTSFVVEHRLIVEFRILVVRSDQGANLGRRLVLRPCRRVRLAEVPVGVERRLRVLLRAVVVHRT